MSIVTVTMLTGSERPWLYFHQGAINSLPHHFSQNFKIFSRLFSNLKVKKKVKWVFLFLTKQQLERLKFRLITFKTFQPMGPGLDSLLHHHTRPTLHPTTPQLVTDRTKITIRTSLSFHQIQKYRNLNVHILLHSFRMVNIWIKPLETDEKPVK